MPSSPITTSDLSLQERLQTVVAIPVTPFDELSGQIDRTSYLALMQRLADGGIQAATPNGNTSEFYALSPQERHDCLQMAGEFADVMVIIAGVGHDIASAQTDALYAAECGAQCIMIHQLVHPYRSLSGWMEYHAEIAAAVPNLGVVPYIKDPAIDNASIAKLLERVPNTVAVKYAIRDVTRFSALVSDLRDAPVAWLCGLAEEWAPFFAAGGATGFTSGLANVDANLSLRMLHALRSNDFEAGLDVWRLTHAFEELRANHQSENNVSVVKEALAQLNLCSRRVRLPCTILDARQRESVSGVLATWDQARFAGAE